MTSFTPPSRVRCVEMYDSTSFCGRGDSTIAIDQRSWHDDGTALSDATCLQCLAAIRDLGEQAAAVLAARIAAGLTSEQQMAWFLEEERKHREILHRALGKPSPPASLAEILKRQYRDPGDEDGST